MARRGWDSNPRARFWQATRFRGGLFQPLRHLSPEGSLTEAHFFSNPARAGRAGLPSCGKKTLHRPRAFFGEHAVDNFDAVVERRMAEDRKARVHGAALGVVATVDEPGDSRMDHDSSTH